MKKHKLIIFFAILASIFVILFLIPLDRDNPPVISSPKWDNPSTEALARRACFDCHSNETNWPWYSFVPPISFIVSNHVKEGREHLNFSEYSKGDGHEIIEEVEKGNMPIPGYTQFHSEANFSAEERKLFLDGLKATFGDDANFKNKK